MPTTLTVLRQRLAETLHDYYSLATTSAGGVAGATLVSTNIRNLPRGTDTDGFIEWYCVLPNGPTGVGSREFRRVLTYTQSSGTVTPQTAFSAQVANAVTFELHRYNPDDVVAALNTTARKSFPNLWVPVLDESLVVDDLLTNPGFETYSAGFTGWTAVGAPTIAQETTRVFHGSNAARITPGVAAGQLTQDVFNTVVADAAGKTMTFKRWVWALAATQAYVRITFDPSVEGPAEYHAGDSSWQLLTQAATIPAAFLRLRADCVVAAAGSAAYFDGGGGGAGLFIDNIYRYTIPTSIVMGPTHVHIQQDFSNPRAPFQEWTAWTLEESGATRTLVFTDHPRRGALIRLRGLGYLTAVSAEADTMEVTNAQVDAIVEGAAAELLYRLSDESSVMDRAALEASALRHQQAHERLLATPGVRMVTGASLHYATRWR